MRRWLLASLFLLSPLGSCSCEDDVLQEIRPGSCEPTFDCSQGFAYRLGECRVARCQDDGDCCPGQRCSVAAGLCANQWVACTDDRACAEIPGRRCIDFRGGRFCGFPNATGTSGPAGTQGCAVTADCPAGASCVGQRCLVAAPCGGGCRDRQVCDLDSQTCAAVPGCSLSCGEGELLVLADPDSMSGDACCAVECACAVLPPVPEGQYGWHASLAAAADGAFVSAYDAFYGDLVVASFDAAGRFVDVEYVDGFPADGPVVANPRGRRGGREGSGPDVGEYGSIARDAAGNLHVAYYDRTQGDLKYARRAGGAWTTHIVDADGDVGRFTSIAIGEDGRPRISYMALDAPGDVPSTALLYAEASGPSPSGPADWRRVEVERRARPEPPCGGGCMRGQGCVDLGEGPQCLPEASGCEPCGAGRICGAPFGAPECFAEISTLDLDDLPPGTGLFSSLAVTESGAPIIAFYDRLDGALRLATGDGAGGFAVETVDGESPELDAGAHVSLAIAPGGRVTLAYMDFTNDDLVYLEPETGLREVVDDGVSPPDLRMVGADASLLFTPTGDPAIAYQDGTRLTLMYARRSGSPARWRTEPIRGAAPASGGSGTAAGFYATQARTGAQAFVGSVAVAFDERSNLRLELTVDVQPLQ